MINKYRVQESRTRIESVAVNHAQRDCWGLFGAQRSTSQRVSVQLNVQLLTALTITRYQFSAICGPFLVPYATMF
jgi:hypothetical protein